MSEITQESWWGRMPSKCSCGRKLRMETTEDVELVFYCREHGVVTRGARERKRGGSTDWKFRRLFRDYTNKVAAPESPSQLTLI